MLRMHWWTHACANKHLDARTCTRTDRQTDGRTDRHSPWRSRAFKHMNACIDERTHVRSHSPTDGLIHTYGLTHARMHTHERLHAYMHTRCTQVHTHGRIDIRTHVRTEANTQEQTWKLEVRSKKLELRNKKCCACIDERTHVRTNIWTHEHARGQTDRQRKTDKWTDGRTDGYSPARIQTHERMHW